MEKSINKTPEILEDLGKNGEVKILNDPESLAAIRMLNENTKDVRRDFIYKNHLSEESAKKVLII